MRGHELAAFHFPARAGGSHLHPAF